MASDLDTTTKRIWDYIVWLHFQWAAARRLFAHSQERVDQMNRRTGDMFRIFRDALLDAVLLDIAKLLDPPQTNKKDNLSLAGAIELLPPDRRDELRVKLKALRRELASVLEHRHRRIAHNDRAVALDIEQAAGVTVGGITDAIRKVAGFLDEIGGGSSDYRVMESDAQKEADLLMKVIARGNGELDKEARARRDAWIRAYGDRDLPDDFDPGEAWAPPAPLA